MKIYTTLILGSDKKSLLYSQCYAIIHNSSHWIFKNSFTETATMLFVHCVTKNKTITPRNIRGCVLQKYARIVSHPLLKACLKIKLPMLTYL